MRLAILSIAACLAIVPAAWSADRPVTDQERSRLVDAVKAAGCSGGKMEFDADKGASHPNGKFEVDDAMCDGKTFDLAFDPDFKLLKKKAD